MKKVPIRRVSKKRQKENKQYSIVAQKYLEDHMICEVCTELEATQIHHRAGRTHERLIDEMGFLAICQPCHSWIHAHPEAARKVGWLLDRI